MPLNPNELTPAQRGPRARRARAVGSVGTCERHGRPGDVRIERLRGAGGAESRRAAATSTTLMQPAMPAAAFGVADIGLDRADQQRLVRAAARRRYCRRGPAPRSDRPAACRCRAPRHSRPRPAQAPASPAPARITRLLGGAVRRGQAAAAAILVDGRAANHGQDRVAVGCGVGEPLRARSRRSPRRARSRRPRRRRSCSGRPATSCRPSEKLMMSSRATGSG